MLRVVEFSLPAPSSFGGSAADAAALAAAAAAAAPAPTTAAAAPVAAAAAVAASAYRCSFLAPRPFYHGAATPRIAGANPASPSCPADTQPARRISPKTRTAPARRPPVVRARQRAPRASVSRSRSLGVLGSLATRGPLTTAGPTNARQTRIAYPAMHASPRGRSSTR